MKTLKEIQDEVAMEVKGMVWDDLHIYSSKDDLWPEVCRRAQLECGKATLDNACTNMNHHCPGVNTYPIRDECNIVIIK